MNSPRSAGSLSLIALLAALLLLLLEPQPASAQATAVAATTTVAPPPPPPTYPADVAVMTGPATFANALAAARRWHNSTLAVVRSASENEVARLALSDVGVPRAWLGAYRDASAASGRQFRWIDGPVVGGSSRPYTN